MGEGFDGILLKSMFVLCFHAFLRVGEISVKSSGHATKLISFLGLPVVSYTSHSFRIGAATNGVPEPVIRELGRWKSDAFKRYIRISPAGTGQH
ncbi:uncharacterized protein LOC141905243 [Tubulanus polymorphus]|uniref:uncharacterized protein LOC141905243 n=1 Tax=Tubulanus polymorphus TaxID=672921 RepID=UPI003DA6958D